MFVLFHRLPVMQLYFWVFFGIYSPTVLLDFVVFFSFSFVLPLTIKHRKCFTADNADRREFDYIFLLFFVVCPLFFKGLPQKIILSCLTTYL